MCQIFAELAEGNFAQCMETWPIHTGSVGSSRQTLIKILNRLKNVVLRRMSAPSPQFSRSSETGKYWTHFVQRVKGCILSNTFWEESQLEQGKKTKLQPQYTQKAGIRAQKQNGKRKADGQKPLSVKLNTHLPLPVCTSEDDQSVQSDTLSWVFPQVKDHHHRH